MKRFSDKIRPFSLALAFLMPVAIESALLAEVLPEVLVAERKEESVLDDIERLTKEAEEAVRRFGIKSFYPNQFIKACRCLLFS